MTTRTILDHDLGNLSQLVNTVIANTQAGLGLLNVGKTAILIPTPITGSAGAAFTMSLNFISGPDALTAIQFDLVPAANSIFTSATLGVAGTAAGKSLSTSSVAGNFRCLIFGLNQTPIGSGVLLTISGMIGTTKGPASLPFINLVGSKADGTTGRFSIMSALMTVQ